MTIHYAEYMAELNRFVKERGGALLMIGGHRAFFGQGRMEPRLAELLPVAPHERIPNYLEEEFKTRVTQEGLRHPIMDVGDGSQSAAAVWEGMPAIGGYNRVAGPAAGGLVLAEYPGNDQGAEPSPLIAVREVGAGRVMAIMTDCSWQWNFLAVGEGKSNKPYQRFYENSLRWLLRDPEMRLISLSSDRGKVKPGEPLTITLEVLDESYQPTDKADFEVKVETQPETSELVLPEMERLGAGKYRMTIKPEVAGAYSLMAEASLNGRPLGRDGVIFEAALKSEEWIEVMPRPELLSGISEATEGASITAKGDPDDFVFKERVVEQVVGARDLPLWDNWIAFLLVFFMMVAGWYMRRKWGLR